MQFYYAHITHDGLKGPEVPDDKQKVLVYVVESIDDIDAERAFRGLESQFQGQNFQILTWSRLSTLNRPILMGVELQPTRVKAKSKKGHV